MLYRWRVSCRTGPLGCCDDDYIYGPWKKSIDDVNRSATQEIRVAITRTPYLRSYNINYDIISRQETLDDTRLPVWKDKNRIIIEYC